jgi:O-antigen ligase
MFLKRAQWVTDKYILLMLGVFPLFWGRVGYSAITKPKALFFLFATGLWALVTMGLLGWGAAKKERYSLTVRPAHTAVALFLAVGGISACRSEYGAVCLLGAGRYDGYLTLVCYGLIFFGVSLLAVPRRRYAWSMALAATLCCCVALVQLAGYDPFGLYPEGTNYYDQFEAYNGAFLGTIGNVDILAAYLCLCAPFLIVYGILSTYKWDTLLILPGVLCLGLLLVCDVDAGLVAAAGCVVVSVPMVIRPKKAARVAGGISAGAVTAGLVGLYAWPGQSGTLWEISQVLHGNLSDEFGSHRGQIWKQGWALFREKPWLGAGPGTVAKRFDIHWSRYIESLGTERRVFVDNAHNVYLAYLMNMGLLGLLSYGAAMVCTVITWFQRRTEGAFFPALGSALVCYWIQDFFGIGLCLSAPLLWVAWGLMETPVSAPETLREETTNL